MRMLATLFLFTLISCEEPKTEETESKNIKAADIVIGLEDVSSDYYGVYSSDCRADSNLEFGQGIKREIVLDSGVTTMEVKEYGEPDCRTLTAIRTYTLDFEIVSKLNEQTEIRENKLEIEYLSSSLNIIHTTYTGYWDCGFTSEIGTDYILNSPCRSNRDGNLLTSVVVEDSPLELVIDNNLVILNKQGE